MRAITTWEGLALIAALQGTGLSASCFFLLRPGWFEMMLTLTQGELDPSALRHMLLTVGFWAGFIALSLFTFALRGLA